MEIRIHERRWYIMLFATTLLSACSHRDANVYQGYVEGEYLYLAAPVGGYLATLDAARGSRAKAGDRLFTLADEPERAAVDEAQAREQAAREQARNLDAPRRPAEIANLEAQMRAAEAALQLSTTQLHQQEDLARRKFVSQARLDEARAAYARDRAQRDALQEQLANYRSALGREAERAGAAAEARAAEAQIAQRRWQMDRKQMLAPAAGEISDSYYRPGEWVAAGQPVLSLLPDARRRIRFFVPQGVVATLKPGQHIEARCDGCAQAIAATIDFIAPQAEYTPPVIYSDQARAKLVFRVEAVPAASDALRLRPGLPVDVRVLPIK